MSVKDSTHLVSMNSYALFLWNLALAKEKSFLKNNDNLLGCRRSSKMDWPTVKQNFHIRTLP